MAAKNLTKAEEQVMQYLWEIESGFLKDVLELLYTIISQNILGMYLVVTRELVTQTQHGGIQITERRCR